jgi:hypothetical protein
MARKFQDFMRDVEAEARHEGPRAVAELAAFDAHFRFAGELLALRKASGLSQRQLSTEAARANPALGTMSVLARALGAEVGLVSAKRHKGGTKVVARRAVVMDARTALRAR